jgi:hypothetical protein
MQLDEAQARTTLTAGPDGRILLSTDAAVSALPAVAGENASALFSAGAIRVGDGETLVVQAPNGGAARLSTGVLEVGAGGRVVMETFVELHAGRAVFAAGSAVVLVGADGGPGPRGGDGARGNRAGYYDGGNAEAGKGGGNGEPGPGGNLYFELISGPLTIIAGGGSGGVGGAGGRGGDGVIAIPGYLGKGGNGGAGGAGGNGGDGGTVVVAFGTLAPGSTIHPVAKSAGFGPPGPGGAGGAGAAGHNASGAPGVAGCAGPPGANGEAPRFLIRTRD